MMWLQLKMLYTQVSAQDNNGVAPFNQDIAKVVLFVLNDFQRFAIVFNSTIDAIQRKEATIVR